MIMTKKRADIVRSLQASSDNLMLARSASVVPIHLRNDMLTGTKLIQLVDGEEQELVDMPQISGIAAVGMIEGGYLVELKDQQRPFGGRVYALSEQGKALDLSGKNQPARWDVKRGVRVFRHDLEPIAAEYGAVIKFNVVRSWWELVMQNPRRVVPLTNDDGTAIAKLSELTVSQWRETIARTAKQSETP